MIDRVCKVISNVLNEPLDQIDESTSSANLDKWDSLKHMNIILAVEQEFGVQFDEELMLGLISVGLIVAALNELEN
ncbi:acyl carrier protein [Maridesulfovibrio zosterae]|uniref:acyl carrier protein n=1 Tax=Maridesulfovibrio zosterae TaxID=82171 RepID=UPI00040ED0F6|nr:acyl carrier protein [Maridesulfovibrio zosterae]